MTDKSIGITVDDRQVLGTGSYGTVYAATPTDPTWAYGPIAVKVLPRATRAFAQGLEREIFSVLRGRQHPSLLTIFGTHFDPETDTGYVIMERVHPATLEDFVEKHGRMDGLLADRVLHDLILGVRALHGAGVAHRDIKPANVSFDPATRVSKLVDYGLACVVPARHGGTTLATGRGTPAFMPPEQLLESHANPFAMDVWALGQSLYVMLTGVEYYAYCRNLAHLMSCVQRPLRVPHFIGHYHEKLLHLMLQKDHSIRPTIHQLYAHVTQFQPHEA